MTQHSPTPMRESRARSSPPRGLTTPVLVVGSSLVAILVYLLLRFDLQLQRWYWSVDWPAWVWALEDVASDEIHDAAIILGVVSLLFCGRRTALAGVGAVTITFIVGQTVKHVLGRVRPCDGGDGLLFVGPSWEHVGFPSGHTAAIWAVAIILSHRFRRLSWLFFAVAVLVTWGRLHADAHFVGDLVAGITVAWLGATLASRWAGRVVNDVGDPASPSRSQLQVAIGLAAAAILPALLLRLATSPSPAYTAEESDRIVTRLYHSILDRSPDTAGAETYRRQLEQSGQVTAIARNLVESPEFVQSIRGLSPSNKIETIYGRLFDRQPTPTEQARSRSTLGEPTHETAVRTLLRRLAHTDEFIRRYRERIPSEMRTSAIRNP